MKKFLLILLTLGLAGCAKTYPTIQHLLSDQVNTDQFKPSENYTHLGLTENEINTLLSLNQIDDYPLYTMHFSTQYDDRASEQPVNLFKTNRDTSWACSLFATFAKLENQLYARNFDWEFSPAILLYTNPPDGYASVSMVDIAYLGFAGDQSANLTEKPLEELVSLLNAPYLPFDGINEAGLVIGMAAVPEGNVPIDPKQDTLGSLEVIRVVLDSAAKVDEALEIMQSYNIDFEGGPAVHYLLSDASGNAALLEHYQGDVHIIRNRNLWHQATNFLNASVDSPRGKCWRYDFIDQQLESAQGNLTVEAAMNLLRDVSQDNTQWSVVYDISGGEINIVMGRNYDDIHVLSFEILNPE